MPSKKVENVMQLTIQNKLLRTLWGIVWLVLFRPSPIPMHSWRCFLLRLFGSTIEKGALPYPSAKIWAPWNLTMRKGSSLSHNVDCYSVDKIELGEYAIVSQYSFLCTASHNYNHIETPLPLITDPIKICKNAWITTGVFIGPGVTIQEGAVVGARSVVLRDVASWTVVAGNPAKFIKKRKLHCLVNLA